MILLFVKIECDPVPKLAYSIVVKDDLTFVVRDQTNRVIPLDVYKSCMKFPKQKLRHSDFLNLLPIINTTTRTSLLQQAIDILMKHRIVRIKLAFR